MSLSAKYQAFLASPSSGALAENGSLHYITTLTSIHDAAAIVKHLSVQEKILKKSQKVLNAVEGTNGLSVDVETTLEFVSGGGAYLPGLDDNFVADRTVTLPMVHIVHFDSEQRIVQMRLYWDQGSLLKQIDVIGARARNWPIRDGRDQSRLIASSSATVAQPESAPSSRPSTAARRPDEVSVTDHPISSRRSTNNAMNDPHASLSLFQPRDLNQEATVSQPIAPRAQSAKPPPREYSELFVGEDPASPSPANAASSPQKRGIPAKSGAGKNFKPSRLFEEETEQEVATPTNAPSPQKRGIPAKSGAGTNYKPNRLFEETEEEKAAPTPISVKTNAKKYNHFEFGDGEDDATPKVRDTARQKSKHMSQWNFDDFVTPDKTKPKVLGQAVRHFGWSDDEDEGSPVRRAVVHKARPDADAHFEFADDGTPEAQCKEASSKGHLHNKGLGLYKDHVIGSTSDDEDGAHKGDTKHALNDVTTHIKNDNRKKDFGAQWEMMDDSPGPEKTSFNGNRLNDNQKKVLKTMDANWGLYEDSPDTKVVNTSNQCIKTAGNGMGGRKGTDASWSLYDESPAQAKKENVGIKSMGNGMGGRKNADSFWDF